MRHPIRIGGFGKIESGFVHTTIGEISRGEWELEVRSIGLVS